MKNPFKKKPKSVEEPKPTVIQTVQGYKLDGVFYDTVEAAKAAYVSRKLNSLCTYPEDPDTYYLGGYKGTFAISQAERNFAAIKALVNEDIKVEPLDSVVYMNAPYTLKWPNLSSWNYYIHPVHGTPRGEKK
jgi:hypothetical protein